jgi:YVTN family beta-propeller protein
MNHSRSTQRLQRCTSVIALASAFSALVVACGGAGGYDAPAPTPPPPQPSVARGPSNSGPIQISPDDKTVWVANPETNSVAAFNVAGDKKELLADIGVGKEPRNLAISPDGKRVFVANAGEDTLSVIDTSTLPYTRLGSVKVGTEPYGLAFTPNGRRLYVANARSNTVSVVDPGTLKVVKTITDVGQEPRGLAITNNGNDKDDVDRAGVFNGSILIGADDYKEGRVAVIATATNTVTKQAVLNPMLDTGFKSNGSSLKKLAPKFDAAGKPVFDVVTGAFPNMLQAVAIKGNRAYLPNTCASPDGPVRFNVNMQSCLAVLDTSTDAEGTAAGAVQTINMNRGINFEVGDPTDERKRLFLAVPWAVAFKNNANEGYAVSLSSNVVVKVALDAEGTPTINAPKQAGDPGAIVRILVGQGPRGIVINGADTRAYVTNENSRDISVIDLATDKVINTFASAALPTAGSDDAKRLIGKAVFDSSTGVKLAALSSPALSGEVPTSPPRLSNEGWGSCVACHGFGRTDNVVWSFGSGLRRTVSLHATFSPTDTSDIKLLNHSAINNEVQDFQNNMLDVSGAGEVKDAAGLVIGGLILDATGHTAGGFDGSGAGGSKPPLKAANAGRSPQLDALAFYVATAVKTPSSPLSAEPASSATGQQTQRGRELFALANCASCHGGAGWASGRFNRLPAVLTATLDQGVPVTVEVLREVGTFNAADANEVKQNGTPGAGALGFNPPSLLGAFGLAPYLHNGSAQTLADVMALKKHRTSGLLLGAPDPFDDAAKRADIVMFLESVDASTVPFPIP